MNDKLRTISNIAGFTGVSFKDKNFLNQLDKNIAEAIIILNSKGYCTIGSCQGHGIFEYIFLKRRVNFYVMGLFGPHIIIKIIKNDYRLLYEKFNTILFKAKKENNLLWITPRFFTCFFIPNSYLCSKIIDICNTL